MSQDRFLESSDPSPEDISVPDVVDFESSSADRPVPEIDLGGEAAPVPPKSDKPLGPRRLALLREQMAQHAKELEEHQSDDPEHVDEDLAQKQQRMAYLASRAALSSDEDREVAEQAMAAGSSDVSESASSEPTEGEATDHAVVVGGGSEQSSAEDHVSYAASSAVWEPDSSEPGYTPVDAIGGDDSEPAPRFRRRDLRGSGDQTVDSYEGDEVSGDGLGEVEGSEFADQDDLTVSDHHDKSSGVAISSVSSVGWAPNSEGATVPAEDETTVLAPTTDGKSAATAENSGTWALATAATGSESDSVADSVGQDDPDELAAGSDTRVSAAEIEDEPGEPVPAVEAQGLDLLPPEDYRQSSRLKMILTILAAVIIPAAIVIVLMMVL